MSTKKNDGGAAFPVRGMHVNPENPNSERFVSEYGMSLRDWFAGMALSGLAVNQEMLLGNHELLEHFGTSGIDKLQANKAYRLADAMLAEREK